MKYQLVIQSSVTDFDRLIALEDEISNLLDGEAILDGHDFGLEEGNIFLFTENPQSNFGKINATLGKRIEKFKIKIAYRELDSSEYISLYPDSSAEFEIK